MTSNGTYTIIKCVGKYYLLFLHIIQKIIDIWKNISYNDNTNQQERI